MPQFSGDPLRDWLVKEAIIRRLLLERGAKAEATAEKVKVDAQIQRDLDEMTGKR